MNVFWIIIDSLSFSATPFAEDSPETMPKMAALTDETGAVFTEAYVPGPKSPSSHGSFLTGQLPSQTGMHEANPSFESHIPTIADSVSETHDSYLISSNPFLFNGLDERFDETTFLNNHDHLLFESGTDPEEFKFKRNHNSRIERYVDFLFEKKRPIRSLLNGLNYKLQSKTGDGSLIPTRTQLDTIDYQSVETMNAKIQAFVDSVSEAFVVANYMDVHPPLNASQKAIEHCVPNKTANGLPIGVSGQRLQEEVDEHGRERVDDLYHATIWDLDRKLTPMIRELVTDGAFVVVTADHGNWFRPGMGLNDKKIHVPLVIFGPDVRSTVVEETVNLVQLPATVMQAIGTDAEGDYQESSVLNISTSQVSITEYIRSAGGGPVNPYGDDHSIRHDVVGIKNASRVDYNDGEYESRGDDSHAEEIEERIVNVLSEMTDSGSGPLDYDESTEERLKELGYL